MSIDRPAMKLDWRGYDAGSRLHDTERRAHLLALAQQFPEGARIVHAGGREGTVTPDQPVHVPGAFHGLATVCLAGEWRDQPMVFAHWDNDEGFDSWGVWVSVDTVCRVASPAVNRPANRASVRRPRRKAGQR